MSLVFPPGGFSRCRVCTGVDASKIPLPLPPGGFVRFGMFLGSSVGPKILDAILLGLLEGTPSSGLPKRLLDSPPRGFMDLEPDSPGWPSAPWNMSAAAPRLSSRRTAVPAWSRAGTLTRPSPLDASRANHTSAAYRRVILRPSPCSNERQAWRVPHRAYSRLAPASASHGFRRRHWTTARPTLRH